MEESQLTSGERLQRQGQAATTGIANLIIIGASAGGQKALVEILKVLPADIPAAIMLLLHMQLGRASSSTLKEQLQKFCRLPIIDFEGQAPLQQGFVFIPPPGTSAFCSGGMLTVQHGVPSRPREHD